MSRRSSRIRSSAALAAAVAAAALALPAPAPAAVTFGTDLARPANATLNCSFIPTPMGPWPTGTTSCTYFTTSATLYPPTEANIVPADAGGYGVITRVRVKVGAATGPMRVVTWRSMKQSSATGEPGCCWPQYASDVFTPAAGTITEIPTRLPVMNAMLLEAYLPFPGSELPSGPNTDPYGGIHEAPTGLQGIETYDQIGLSVLDGTTPIPAQYDGDRNVTSGLFWPDLRTRDIRLLTLGQNGNGSVMPGVHVLLQAVWEPDTDRDGLGDETQDPQVGGAGVPPQPQPVADVTAPVLAVQPARRTLAALRARGLPVTATCDEACKLTAKLLLARSAAKRVGLARTAAPVAVGSASKALGAAGTAKLTVKLSRKAARALRRTHKVALTLETTATDAAGNRAVGRKALTFR